MKDDGEPSFKFGNCPKCKQDAALTWFIGKIKGTDQIVSGWVCNECFREMRKGDENQCQRTDASAAEQ